MEPRVEVMPLSSQGSQLVPPPEPSPSLTPEEESMRKRRRLGRKRRRRPQYYTLQGEMWPSHKDGAFVPYKPQEADRYRLENSNNNDWSPRPQSYQAVLHPPHLEDPLLQPPRKQNDRFRDSFAGLSAGYNKEYEDQDQQDWEPQRPVEESGFQPLKPQSNNNEFLTEIAPPPPSPPIPTKIDTLLGGEIVVQSNIQTKERDEIMMHSDEGKLIPPAPSIVVPPPSFASPSASPSPAQTPKPNKSYRKPYSAKKAEEQKQAEEDLSPAAKLKAILKQSGGLSLSEVLQQKNVSLADLLKGKQMAIAALVQNPENEDKKHLPAEMLTNPERTKPTPSSKEVVPDNGNDKGLETEDSNESTREQKEYRIKSYKRRKQPVRVVDSNSDDDDVRPTRRVPLYGSSSKSKYGTHNKLDEDGGINQDEDSHVFPTVEVKQMALNPVIPAERPEKVKPIKPVVPKIRPDFSNSKSKTEESFESSRRRNHPSKLVQGSTTTSPVSSSPSVQRERWTPGNNNRERLPSRIPYTRSTHRPDVTSDINGKTESVDDVPPTTTPGSSHRTRPPMLTSTTPKNIDIIRNRLSVKPRIRIPVRPRERIRIHTTLSPGTSLNTTEVPFIPQATEKVESDMTTTLKQDETDMNIIDKFTSFEDTKPKNVESIEQIFPSRSDRLPPSRIKKINSQNRSDENKSKPTSSTEVKFSSQEENQATIDEDSIRPNLGIVPLKTNLDITEAHPSLFSDLIGPSVDEEKNEILQLLEDRRGGNKLTKVLEARNMSVDELMEHRQRGSSHLHLQQLLKSKQRLAELAKSAEPVDIVTAFENFPKFEIDSLRSVQPDDIRTDSNGFSYYTSIINIRPTDEIYKEARALQDMHKLEKITNRQFKTLTFPTDSTRTSKNDGNILKLDHSRPTAPSSSVIPDETLAEQIERQLRKANEQHLETTKQVMIENKKTHNGVRSAIMASSAIVALSLLVFAIVFALFRWRQKRRNKLNYSDAYKYAKGRLPIMNKPPMRDNSNVSPVLCAKHRHSNRLSRMNTMDPNSPDIHDYLGWDHMRKPFQ